MRTEINIYQSESQIVRDAIDKIIVQVYRKKREENHKSFLITGCSAGCGATNTAINMAVALANAGWHTVLVDCDIRKGMEYKRLNQEIDQGLSDYLMGETTDAVYPTNYKKLDYIPCGNNGESPVRLLATKEMEKLDSELKEQYDFVIYDFPSIAIVPDAGILIPVVDDVILVAAVNETSRKQLSDAKNKVKSCGDKYMGVILNKMELPEYKHYIKNYDYFGKDQLKKKHTNDMRKKKDSAAEDRQNGEQNEKENKKEKKNRRGFFLGILVMLLTLFMPETVQATGEGNPRILIEDYYVSGDEIVPGEEFELTLKVRNTSLYYDAFTVIISLMNNSKSVFPIYGDSNQVYIERVYARSSTEITIPLKAAEVIEDSVVQVEMYITFNDDHYVDKQYGTSYLYLPVRLSGDLSVVTCEVPEQATLGTRARVSVSYENTGISRLRNVKMTVSSNDEIQVVDLYNLEGGSQNIAEAYLNCSELGEMPVAISFTYEDENGEKYETEDSIYGIQVTESETDSAVTQPVSTNKFQMLTVVSFMAIIGVAAIIVLIIRRKR